MQGNHVPARSILRLRADFAMAKISGQERQVQSRLPHGDSSQMTRLSQRASASLPAFVARPAYDRSALRRRIVHLGLGAFHRAHQAVYTEAAMAEGDLRWGIAGVSLRSKSVADALVPQDLLYCVLQRDGEQVNARLVGALHAALHAPSQL